MNDLIKRLVETWGPSGYEHRIRALIQEEVADLADEIRVDPLGNLICRVGSGGPKVMIAAHMDEIGMMATYIEPESGYLRFANIGGLINSTLLGNRVRFENGTLGVIGVPDSFGSGRTSVPNLEQISTSTSARATAMSPGRSRQPWPGCGASSRRAARGWSPSRWTTASAAWWRLRPCAS